MNHIKTFENFDNQTTFLYRIVVKDRSLKYQAPTYGIVTSLKTRSEKTEEEVKKDFIEGEYYKKLIKNQPPDKYFVDVKRIFDPVGDNVKIVDIK